MYQLSFDDIERNNNLTMQPGRTAFIDECGSFGFDFEKGASPYYVVSAVIVKNDQILNLEEKAEIIRRTYFQTGEMKSKLIGKNYSRRAKICTELLMLDFSLIILIADKQAFYQDSPLKNYRDSFIKFLHQKLYEVMYAAYPKLKIVEDEYGSSEFKIGFQKYVRDHRPKLNLLNDYDFDFVDSKRSRIVQISDIIAGSVDLHLLDENAPDFLTMFQSKIRGIEYFPNKYPPCLSGTKAENNLDKEVYDLAVHCATNYINKHKDIDNEDERLRVLFIRHLLYTVRIVNPSKFISSPELIKVLAELAHCKISRDYLYRMIIAPLRDEGIIIASSTQGYKIPTCIDDIFSYTNQTNTKVGPMLSRIEICRKLILMQTDGKLDIFDNPALTKYKRYFGDF